jgi:glycosyltransferase involved in cell wall biosynthesis
MFKFLKYIQPLWYYRLAFQHDNGLLFNNLFRQSIDKLADDNRFSSQESRNMDRIYRALQMGFIPSGDLIHNEEIGFRTITHRNDNYKFVAKYFGMGKLIYVLLLRILCLNNPILELRGFFKAIKIQKIDITLGHSDNENFETFQSQIIRSNPLVTVVIPTLNRYEYLKDVLKDLEAQDYQNFEVIVCDQTDVIPSDFYVGWNLNIQLIKQEEKALWLARNRCIKQAKGEYILLFDDDSRVKPNWIKNHLKCLEYFNVKISAGVTHTLVGHGLGKKESYFHLSDVFDTGNSMVHIEVFKQVGLFDRQFEKMRMGDGEFGLRAILGGFLIVSNPHAMRIHLKVETGGLRQMGSWDALRPKSLFAPRPVPSVLYLARKYFGNTAAKFYLIQNIPFSFIPYKYKKSSALKLAFIFMIPLLSPLLIAVVIQSWKKSTKMLKQGDKIVHYRFG